jgi:hypothetical protein
MPSTTDLANWIHNYEELRERVTQGGIGKSIGLAIVISRGLGSWMQLITETPTASKSHTAITKNSPVSPVVPLVVRDEMIHAIASMLLGSTQEVAYGA